MSESTTIEGLAYGPLASLVGVWTGEKGLDIAPEPGVVLQALTIPRGACLIAGSGSGYLRESFQSHR